MKAGLETARAKGKRLGRPKKFLDTKRIATLRTKGIGWKRIAAEMGVGVGTIYRVAIDGSKTLGRFFELFKHLLRWSELGICVEPGELCSRAKSPFLTQIARGSVASKSY